MGQFGSDSYLYDFAKRNEKQVTRAVFGSKLKFKSKMVSATGTGIVQEWDEGAQKQADLEEPGKAAEQV